MSTGKLVALVVMGALGWQHQAMIRTHVQLVREIPDLVQTHMEMRTYQVALLRQRQKQAGELPRDPVGWIRSNYDTSPPKDPHEDFFGTPYRVTYENPRRLPELRSCGFDRQCGTGDDVVKRLYME